MNENEIKIAESFNILDKCQKLEKDFLRLSRITKVEFDLNGLYDNIYHDNICLYTHLTLPTKRIV